MAYTPKQLARVFKALGNENRIQIIKFIAKRPRSVLEITKRLRVLFKTASFHLLRLEREGPVKREHKGKYNYYSSTGLFRGSGVFKQIIQSK